VLKLGVVKLNINPLKVIFLGNLLRELLSREMIYTLKSIRNV
jgi:hypothetical protein